MSTVAVRYTCGTCPVNDAKVSVRECGADEDVVAWVEQAAAAAVAQDHRRRSPFCPATTMKAMKIPVPPGEDARIGEDTKH